MRVIARALSAIETDEEPDGARLRRAIDCANADRRTRGTPELELNATPPEEEFYRRARALGFRRRRR